MQAFDEGRVRLAMNLHKGNTVNHNVFKYFGVKGIGSRVAESVEHVLFCCRHYWGKLEEVTDQDNLDATERDVPFTRNPKGPVNDIEQIGANHRNLVDHHALDASEQLPLAGANPDFIMIYNPRRNTEERVHCLAAEVQSCHACWCKKDLLFVGILLERIQKRCLSSSSTTKDHDCRGWTVHKLKCAIGCR
jgi:hypothetical protein